MVVTHSQSTRLKNRKNYVNIDLLIKKQLEVITQQPLDWINVLALYQSSYLALFWQSLCFVNIFVDVPVRNITSRVAKNQTQVYDTTLEG